VLTITKTTMNKLAASYHKEMLKRLDDIEELDQNTKQHLFFLIDNVIQNYKTKRHSLDVGNHQNR
jgi:hypothetical protein